MDLSAIEHQVAADRASARDRSAEAELRLAASLCEFAKALIATKTDGSRDRSASALEPAQEATLIRLRWLTAGHVTAVFANEVQEALRLFELAARTIGHRELATHTIRNACHAYRQVAQQYPNAAAVCADALSKCGVWLCRLDPNSAVAACEDAVRIRAALFAADPEQANRYLSSLNTLLRTLMVGRQRKQALSMYRDTYAAVTSPAMTQRLREIRIEDIGFTSKTSTALLKLDCTTLERAGYLTQQQILYQTSGDLATIEEVNWQLALVGLKPLAAGALADPPSKPVEISTSFGALSVRCSSRNAVTLVRAAILAAYSADGAQTVPSTAYLGVDEKHWSTFEPETNTAERLGEDVILIEKVSEHWVSVKSLNWELAPVGKHPLALRLSQEWPVVSVTTTEHMSYELCWYEGGSAVQYAALGLPAGQIALEKPLAPLDFAALSDYGADYASETQVRAAFGNTAMFAKLTKLPASGIRQAAESGPLEAHGSNILYFRAGVA
ncbi:hypothetical protein JK358_07270 [Nocardia sp. 2]|uniref:Uncharacterized protein n=1 Tax=Nocardia acididurans TaxID=2802282 RepID=A0ABS1M1V7_9NOCA|nr:hypothetical protein [Nocardia acididurans]MBL1074194.1 hypothetical protein [Nocardia acididurans]